MKINILTIFPEMFEALNSSMLGKAIENGILEFNVVDIRDYTLDKHNRVDDTPYGGGAGMVMQVQPIVDAYEQGVLATTPVGSVAQPVIYMSPRGALLNGDIAAELASLDEFTVLCGHYEGVDQRALDILNVREVSIGDYVLTGGELPAMVLIDTVARFIDGVLASEESVMDESVYSGLLEAPHYTKPRTIKHAVREEAVSLTSGGFEDSCISHAFDMRAVANRQEHESELDVPDVLLSGNLEETEQVLAVPDVLLSGNHQEIELWRWDQALELTRERRPDMFRKYIDSLQLRYVGGRGRNTNLRLHSDLWGRKLTRAEQAIIEKYR